MLEDYGANVLHAHELEVACPVDDGIVGLQLVDSAQVVELGDVALLGTGHARLGKLVLNIIDSLGGALSVFLLVASEHEHLH